MRGNSTKLTAFYKTISKQVVLFSLLFAFINTIVFPSLILVAKQSNLKTLISAESERTSTLAEYILEGYLQVCDSTADDKEDDIKDVEKLFDEVDLLNHIHTRMVFQKGNCDVIKYIQDKYPLKFFSYNSPTPPPEC